MAASSDIKGPVLPWHCTRCDLQLVSRRFNRCPVCRQGRIVFNPASGCIQGEAYTVNNYHAMGKAT